MLACALAGSVTFAGVARADEPAVVDAGLLAQQRQIFDRANKLYDAQKLPEALAAYLEAWNLRHTFDVAGNLGNLEADLERWRPAAEHLAFAVREFPAGGKPSARDKLLERLAEAEKHVGRLRVLVNRTGAQVFVDGVAAGLAPIAGVVYVEPGQHVVEARIDGSTPLQVTVVATQQRTEEVTLAFVGDARSKGPNRVVIIVGSALAGASAVAGAVLAGLWASKGSSATSLAAQVPRAAPCPVEGTGATGTCASLVSALHARADFGGGAVGAFVAAGAIGVGTVVYALVARPRAPRPTGVWVGPLVSPSAGGVLLGSSF